MCDIVITGIGVVSSIGIGKEAFWEGCREARSGLGKITAFDTEAFRTNIGGEVQGFDPGLFMAPRTYRRMSRISRMAVASSVEALKDSGLDLGAVDRERVGILMGTAYGSSSHVEAFYVSLLKEGPRGAQPFLFPETVPNAPASHIAMVHTITGPNSTFCQNALSAENAMAYAVNLLSQDVIDAALVGGAEELSEMQYGCYDAVGALNKTRVRDGEAVRPRLGGGLVLGEGAAVLVMEKEAAARKRGARVYGRLASGVLRGSSTAMGHYKTGEFNTAEAMGAAIKSAGLTRDEIGHVHVSANFSRELDPLEYEQLAKMFPERIDALSVTPLKYLTGDFGGAGAARAAGILLSLHHRTPLPAVKAEILTRQGSQDIEWIFPTGGTAGAALMTTTTFGGGTASFVFTRT